MSIYLLDNVGNSKSYPSDVEIVGNTLICLTLYRYPSISTERHYPQAVFQNSNSDNRFLG